MVADVDPYVNHPQITEYVHYLDPWGQALGREVGNVCLYGKTDLANSEVTKQCGKFWGVPGIVLYFQSSLGMDTQLVADFKNCRYRTHAMDKVVIDIRNGTFVKADGTTDGGCSLDAIVPRDGGLPSVSLRSPHARTHARTRTSYTRSQSRLSLTSLHPQPSQPLTLNP